MNKRRKKNFKSETPRTFNNPEEAQEFLRHAHGLYIQGHTSIITSIAISRDSKLIVSGSDDNTVRIWDFHSRLLRGILKGHSSLVASVAITNDSKSIVSASADRTIRIWAMYAKQQETILHGHDSDVNTVAISENDKYIISGSADRTIRIWNLRKRQQDAIFYGHTSAVTCIAITSNNKYIVSGSVGHSLRLWDFKNQIEPKLANMRDRVIGIAISSNDKEIIVGLINGCVNVLSLPTLIFTNTFRPCLLGLSGRFYHLTMCSMGITHDNKCLIYSKSNGEIYTWEINGYKHCGKPKANGSWVNSIAITSDDKYIAVGSSDKNIKVFGLYEDLPEIITMQAHTAELAFVAITRDNMWMVSCCKDRVVKLWNLKQKRVEATRKAYNSHISSMILTNNGNYFMVGCWDGKLSVLNVKEKLKETLMSGHKNCIRSIAVVYNNKYVVSVSMDMEARVWKLHSLHE